jgi:hypothetical protein
VSSYFINIEFNLKMIANLKLDITDLNSFLVNIFCLSFVEMPSYCSQSNGIHRGYRTNIKGCPNDVEYYEERTQTPIHGSTHGCPADGLLLDPDGCRARHSVVITEFQVWGRLAVVVVSDRHWFSC